MKLLVHLTRSSLENRIQACGDRCKADHEDKHVLQDLREREESLASSNLQAAQHGEDHPEYTKSE